MAAPQQVFNDYVQLRKGGLEATTVLQMLRAHIELLPSADRTEIVKQVKQWESRHQTPQQSPAMTTAATPKMPLAAKSAANALQSNPFNFETPQKPLKVITPPKETTPAPDKAAGTEIACPNCNKLNAATEVLCYSCGYVLKSNNSPFATSALAKTNGTGTIQDSGFFGGNATLALQLRGTSKIYHIQPQNEDHEMIIGRSDGSAMQPDIDLADQNAGQLGVSRMHMTVQYSKKHNTISICDLNSANGTYVNGQKLHPHEVRVLRHGDELRLGSMVFQVMFQQPR